MALLEDRPKADRPVAAAPPDTRARLRPVHERSVTPPAAWLLDIVGLSAEFSVLWDALGNARPDRRDPGVVHPGTDRLVNGDTTALRTRAAEVWSSTDPMVASVVAHLEVSGPEDWEGARDDRHLGHWFRLVMAAHVVPAVQPSGVDELRTGLPLLGFTQVEARRAARGREFGELAMELSPHGYGPAVSLSLGHGHKGWLGGSDAALLQNRLASLPPRAFQPVQELVAPCEALWRLLGTVAGRDDQVLVISAP
jgi:hypothetical protein